VKNNRVSKVKRVKISDPKEKEKKTLFTYPPERMRWDLSMLLVKRLRERLMQL
jgi:hypothetical protein